MPSNPRKLPWFLDVLRWTRAVSHPHDRGIIDMVREDLGEDLDELLEGGASRGQAYRAVWRQTRFECRVFVLRALRFWKARCSSLLTPVGNVGRRALKPAIGVGLAGALLIAAKVLWFDRTALDRFDAIATKLAEAREQLDEAQASLMQLEGQATDRGASFSPQAQSLIVRITDLKNYFERTERDYPGRFFLSGVIGLIDEELALFWSAQGDDERSASHRNEALRFYKRGAERGDPVALLHLGIWHLDQDDPRSAVGHLRRAHERWPLLRVPGGNPSGHVAMKYHVALLGLWKAEKNPVVAIEARRLEKEAVRELESGSTRETTFVILYNAACLRVLMIQAGVRDPIEGLDAFGYLHRSFEAAGESKALVAGWIVSDPDLDGLRGMPAFDEILSKAKAVLEAADQEK